MRAITIAIATALALCAFFSAAAESTENVTALRKAADAGNAKAMTCLGACYASGTGVPQDDAEAAKWWRKAADAGDVEAMTCLGAAYVFGSGVPQDDTEAVKWWSKAAAAGDAMATGALGVCYSSGKGVPKDEAKAMKLWNKAADAGNIDSMCTLGFYYARGQHGVSQNHILAYMWYSLAAAKGSKKAIELQNTIVTEMTEQEIAEGKRLAAERSRKK